MTAHGDGLQEAHDFYVYQQMTFDEIAKRLGRSDRTIRTWAEDNNWKEQRKQFLQSRTSVHEKLHKLVEKLTDRMISDCSTDTELSPQSLHALTNLVSAMNNLYKYEDKKQDEVIADNVQKPATPEEITARVREILGV